jgi:hypothetical protein
MKMTKQKIKYALICISIGITITYGILGILLIIDREFYGRIIYHYSDNFTWITLFLLIPLAIGFLIYYKTKNKQIVKSTEAALRVSIVQYAFILIFSVFSYFNWGYAFKRPTVFKEVKKAEKVLTCTRVSNVDSLGVKPLFIINYTTKESYCLYDRSNSYYGKTDRVFMVFEDRSHKKPELSKVLEIYRNPEQNVSEDVLQNIEKQIFESGIIDKGKPEWDTCGTLRGVITEFVTSKNEKYLFAGLDGGEVSNDHYPFYEFLFKEKNQEYKLIKKQRFYTDIAGAEGFEYSKILPVFSVMVIISIILSFILLGFKKIICYIFNRIKK